MPATSKKRKPRRPPAPRDLALPPEGLCDRLQERTALGIGRSQQYYLEQDDFLAPPFYAGTSKAKALKPVKVVRHLIEHPELLAIKGGWRQAINGAQPETTEKERRPRPKR